MRVFVYSSSQYSPVWNLALKPHVCRDDSSAGHSGMIPYQRSGAYGGVVDGSKFWPYRTLRVQVLTYMVSA